MTSGTSDDKNIFDLWESAVDALVKKGSKAPTPAPSDLSADKAKPADPSNFDAMDSTLMDEQPAPAPASGPLTNAQQDGRIEQHQNSIPR